MRSKMSLWMCMMMLVLTVWAQSDKNAPAARSGDDYSGMYSFLQDGEFVQLTVESDGRVTGFVSRYGELESDKGVFLNQFFKQAKLDGHNLSYTTQTLHGTWFEFKGTVERGEGKTPKDEGYYVMKGTLTQHNTDENKKTTARSREVVFKLFPAGTDADDGKQE